MATVEIVKGKCELCNAPLWSYDDTGAFIAHYGKGVVEHDGIRVYRLCALCVADYE